jgi:hypothetical protein
MDMALWIGLGLIALFFIRVIFWLIQDFKENNH